jgi:hypothetical protein
MLATLLVPSILSYPLLCKDVKLTIYKTINCSVWVLNLLKGRSHIHGYERIVRGITGPKRREITSGWKKG